MQAAASVGANMVDWVTRQALGQEMSAHAASRQLNLVSDDWKAQLQSAETATGEFSV